LRRTILELTLKHIKNAAERIEKSIIRTPLIASEALASYFHAKKVFLKLENLQYTGSFKDRGALNKFLTTDKRQLKKGVVAASAGNHAQAVAHQASRMGIPATIVMPESTPTTKVSRTKCFGANVILKGNSFDEAYDYGLKIAADTGQTYIPAFDDNEIIAGQGTVGLEILQDCASLDILVVPIGGGGLISGIGIAAKTINPNIKIYGVVSSAYPDVAHKFRGEKVHHLKPKAPKETIAEGIAVKNTGAITMPLISKYVDDVLIVDEHYIEQAIFILAERKKIITEGAGAASLAALLQYRHLFHDKEVCLTLSGGNIDLGLLSSVLQRGLVRSGRLVRLSVNGPDRPGMVAAITKYIAEEKGNVIEITHHRVFYDLPVKKVEIEIVVEFEGQENYDRVRQKLINDGYAVRNLDSLPTSDDFLLDQKCIKTI
jgi:threonine dehydratase